MHEGVDAVHLGDGEIVQRVSIEIWHSRDRTAEVTGGRHQDLHRRTARVRRDFRRGNEPVEGTTDGAVYWNAMEDVLSEILRVLRPGRHAAMYVCDVWKRNTFVPIGARLTVLIEKRFEMVDHVAVVRGNKDLKKGNYHKAAEETNFFLCGFNHLLIFRKPEGKAVKQPPRGGRRRG